MKSFVCKTCLFFILLLYSYTAYTQLVRSDSLKKVLQTQKEDTNKVNTLNNLSFSYAWSSADTGLTYAQQALDLAEKLNFEQGILNAELSLSNALTVLGNYPLSLDYGFKALSLAKKIGRPFPIMQANGNLGECYYYLGEYNTSLKYFRENSKLNEQFFRDQPYFVWVFMCKVFEGMHQPDSAILYGKKAYEKINSIKDLNEELNYGSLISPILGNAFAGKNEYDSALFYYRMGIPLSIQNHTEIDMIDCYNGIAKVYKAKGNPDSAVWYAKKVLNEKMTKTYPVGLLKAANILADIYESQNKPDSTLKYLKKAISIKDSLFNREKTIAVQNLIFKEQEKQKAIEAAKLQSQNRLKMYSLLGGLFTVLAIAGLLFRNNRQKQKANNLITQQKQKVESTLIELKSTQSQLIQSEKMASLGELTAGIAHEIQNPLNFVNNFSEVNKEMLEELKAERLKPKAERDEQTENEIINDVIDNEEKINHHGKRADAIVKGMLQHSRASTGKKEPTNINALADEYLRLSYHGMRAKEKDFNADFKTDFDRDLSSVEGKINIIPQDIGRVLLNLFNNAFYAVNEKQKHIDPEDFKNPRGLQAYKPLVSVQTKRINDKVEIIVKDNGNGIPQNIIDKIFQPFFTTKPTGQATGLGLSLSYDIVKAHGGEIKVETPPAGRAGKEGERVEFVIQLPIYL